MSGQSSSWMLERDQCVSCGVCADLCPEKAIIFFRDSIYPEQLPELCNSCLICQKECPVEVIRIEDKIGKAD